MNEFGETPSIYVCTGTPPMMPIPIRLHRFALLALGGITALLAGVAVAVGSAIIVSLIESNPL